MPKRQRLTFQLQGKNFRTTRCPKTNGKFRNDKLLNDRVSKGQQKNVCRQKIQTIKFTNDNQNIVTNRNKEQLMAINCHDYNFLTRPVRIIIINILLH